MTIETTMLLVLARTTLGLSAAITLVLLMRPLLRRWFGAQAAYALWAMVPLVAVAMLMPAPSTALQFEIGAMPAIATPGAASAGAAALPARLVPGLLIVHLTGLLLMIAWMAAGQRRFVRRLGGLTALGDGVWQSERSDVGPSLVGVWRPRIVVPADFDLRYRADERALILAHERAHRRHGDPAFNALLTALLCLQWFNPLVHLAAGRYRRDQELTCDARVLRRFPAERRRYAEAMLKTQQLDLTLPLGCTWQSPHPLEERIVMLQHALPGRLRRSLGSAAVAALILTTAGAAWAVQSAAIEPTYARLTPPAYPAAMDGVLPEGTVYLKVYIGVDGVPQRVDRQRVVPATLPASVEAALVESAIAAARTWTFNPAQRDGKAIAGEAIVPIRFSATEEPASAPGTPADKAPAGALDEITVRHP